MLCQLLAYSWNPTRWHEREKPAVLAKNRSWDLQQYVWKQQQLQIQRSNLRTKCLRVQQPEICTKGIPWALHLKKIRNENLAEPAVQSHLWIHRSFDRARLRNSGTFRSNQAIMIDHSFGTGEDSMGRRVHPWHFRFVSWVNSVQRQFLPNGPIATWTWRLKTTTPKEKT